MTRFCLFTQVKNGPLSWGQIKMTSQIHAAEAPVNSAIFEESSGFCIRFYKELFDVFFDRENAGWKSKLDL